MATKISNLNDIEIAKFVDYERVEVPCVVQQKSSGSNDETKWFNYKVSLKDLKDNLDVRISDLNSLITSNSTNISLISSVLNDNVDLLSEKISENSTKILNL